MSKGKHWVVITLSGDGDSGQVGNNGKWTRIDCAEPLTETELTNALIDARIPWDVVIPAPTWALNYGPHYWID